MFQHFKCYRVTINITLTFFAHLFLLYCVLYDQFLLSRRFANRSVIWKPRQGGANTQNAPISYRPLTSLLIERRPMRVQNVMYWQCLAGNRREKTWNHVNCKTGATWVFILRVDFYFSKEPVINVSVSIRCAPIVQIDPKMSKSALLTIHQALRRSFHSLENNQKLWKSVLAECIPLTASLENLGAQSLALSNVQISNTPLKDFPEVEGLLRFKLSQAMDTVLCKLHENM